VFYRAVRHNLKLHNQENKMKSLRRIFAACVLILAFTLSSFAGDMSTPLAPPTASSQGEMSTPVNGDIQNDVAGDMHTTNSEAVAAGDSVAADVLGLVLGALSLL
jgi:hypothetical protein